ncbi:MAG: hypothetical protein ACOY3Y_10025 [Acidobacteriota bacterium]
MPWILDGNNLAGGRSRDAIRKAALDLARRERLRIVLYFDGAPPPGSAAVEKLGTLEVRYVPHADSAILGTIGADGRGWRLATDDRELASRAKAAGAAPVAAEAFWKKLEGAAGREREQPGPRPDGYPDGVQPLPEVPGRVPRRRRR